jgi:cytoskeletal protein CcmA (bactofilin family)
MFKKETTKKELEQLSNSSTIIGKGTILEGNIETLGNLRIEGKAIGNVKSKSKIALGDSSLVEGNIMAQNAEIAGEVKGSIEVSDLLILKSGSIIHGDIITNRIVIESGASFNGQCKMGAVKEITLGQGNREQKLEEQRTAWSK